MARDARELKFIKKHFMDDLMGIPRPEGVSTCPVCNGPLYWDIRLLPFLIAIIAVTYGLTKLFSFYSHDLWYPLVFISLLPALMIAVYPKREPGFIQKRKIKKWEQQLKEEADSAQYVYPNKIRVVFFFLFLLLFEGISEWLGPYIKPYVMQWVNQSAHNEAVFTLIIISSPMVLTTLVAIYYWILAFIVRRTKKYPPRGFIIMTRTIILTGEPAVRKCRQLILTGFYVIGFGCVFLGLTFHTFGPGILKILKHL
jgi:hypothetical protein